MEPCRKCGGRLFRPSAAGWQRCECYWDRAQQTFIKPQIRGRDETLPPEWLAKTPWPLEDRDETGTYDDFRRMVWVSLLPHVATPAFRYDYFDASRLLDIMFERDTGEYRAVRELKDLDLLVLLTGWSDPRNEYLPMLIDQVLRLRQQLGHPTWQYHGDRRQHLTSAPYQPTPLTPTDHWQY